jgi:hypothetical protein
MKVYGAADDAVHRSSLLERAEIGVIARLGHKLMCALRCRNARSARSHVFDWQAGQRGESR